MSIHAPPQTLTPEQIQKLYDAIGAEHPEHIHTKQQRTRAVVVLLALDAGLRIGEIHLLRREHVIFNGVVLDSVTITPDITKTKRERTVPLSHRLKMILQLHLDNALAGDTPNSQWPVVYGFDVTLPLTIRQMQRIIADTTQHAIGFPVHPHFLRHTFATRLIKKTNLRIVQELLGHVSIQSTQIYTHPTTEDMKNAISQM